MSNVNNEEMWNSLEPIAVEKTTCYRCEAKPAEQCVTVSGKKTKTHTTRVKPLEEAYLMGRQTVKDLFKRK